MSAMSSLAEPPREDRTRFRTASAMNSRLRSIAERLFKSDELPFDLQCRCSMASQHFTAYAAMQTMRSHMLIAPSTYTRNDCSTGEESAAVPSIHPETPQTLAPWRTNSAAPDRPHRYLRAGGSSLATNA